MQIQRVILKWGGRECEIQSITKGKANEKNGAMSCTEERYNVTQGNKCNHVNALVGKQDGEETPTLTGTKYPFIYKSWRAEINDS